MFGKLNVGRDGERGQGVVLKAERHGGVSDSSGTSSVTYDLELRVHFEDGTSLDFSQRLGSMFKSAEAGFAVGDVVPVRFDPDHHERIEVDMAAIHDRQDAVRHEADEMKADRAQRVDARLAEGKLPPMTTTEMLKASMELQARLASGAITQAEFEAERDAIKERQSLY
jgi:hypothetical protein